MQPFDSLKLPHKSYPFIAPISNLHNKLFFIEICRLIFYVLVTLSFLAFQITNHFFIIPDINNIFYTMLFLAFLLNSIYLLFFYHSKYLLVTVIILFVFDTFFISSLVHITQNTQPIFLFLYLINILLFGLIFPWRGAFFLALLTSFLFTVLLILNPYIVNSNLAFALGVNNMAFFLVAFLSSYLSSQMGFMGQKIEHQTQNIHTLQDMNKLILETMPSGLIVFDTKGYIMQFNISAKNILEKNLLRISISSLLKDLNTYLNSPIYQKKKHIVWEETYTLQSTEKRLGLTLTPLTTENRKWKNHLRDISQGTAQSDPILGHILLIQDLTNIKRLEEVARRNEKMAAIGQLAAGIAHEIRNPLASISGSIQLLEMTLSQDGDGTENKRLYNIVLKEIDRLNLLITEFLNYARPEKIPNDQVNIHQVLKDTLEKIKLNHKLPSHVKQNVDLRSKGSLIGQVEKLEQVFLNLMLNAYQAMEKTHPAQIFVKSYNKGGCLFVSIKDTGPGLNPEVKDRIFEPFVTTKSSGTGLGLATTHKILENHKAKIHVNSEKNKGTEFLIEFTRLYDVENKSNVVHLEQRKTQNI